VSTRTLLVFEEFEPPTSATMWEIR
jgi:hypothetical protein